MWGHHFAGFFGPGHGLISLLLLVAAGVAVYLLLRRRGGGTACADREDSLEILKRRLARGEINLEEFNTLKKVL